jgi:outer membrane biosynthesis protein TonB
MLLRCCEGALGQCFFSVGCNSILVLFLLVATTTRSLLFSWTAFFSCCKLFFVLPAFSFCEKKKNASNATTQATCLVVVAFTIDQLAMKMNQAGVGVGDAQARVLVGAAAAAADDDDDDAAAAGVGGGCVRDEMIERRDNSNRCRSSSQEIGTAVVVVAAAGRAGFQAVVSDSVVAAATAATESENTLVNSIVTESSKDENNAVEEVEEDEDEEQEEEEEEQEDDEEEEQEDDEEEEQEDDEEEEQEEGRIDEHEEEHNDDSVEETSEEEEEDEEEEEEQEQKKQVLDNGSKPTVVVTGRILLAPSGKRVMTNDGMLDLVSDVAGYMEDDSRSRSENGIGAIGGGVTRIGDDNAERSRRQLEDVDLIDWEAPTPTPAQSEREREHRLLFQELSLMDSDVVTEEASGEEGRRIHEKTDSLVVAMSATAAAAEEDKEEETAAAIDNNNTRSIGKEAQGSFRTPSSSAYTRALSKIFKSKSPSSETVREILSSHPPTI